MGRKTGKNLRATALPWLRITGSDETVNSQDITVYQRDEDNNILFVKCSAPISNGGAGYAIGCQAIQTDGAGGTTYYINEGTATSCAFVVFNPETGVRYASVSLTNAEMLALRAAPKTLIAAPGAGKVIEFLSAILEFDYTGAYTESADNMAIRYTNGSGVIVSDTIEATGFVDATADTITFARKAVDGIVAAAGAVNQALVLHNTGDGEYGGGNAANVVNVRVAYRVHTTGF